MIATATPQNPYILKKNVFENSLEKKYTFDCIHKTKRATRPVNIESDIAIYFAFEIS